MNVVIWWKSISNFLKWHFFNLEHSYFIVWTNKHLKNENPEKVLNFYQMINVIFRNELEFSLKTLKSKDFTLPRIESGKKIILATKSGFIVFYKNRAENCITPLFYLMMQEFQSWKIQISIGIHLIFNFPTLCFCCSLPSFLYTPQTRYLWIWKSNLFSHPTSGNWDGTKLLSLSMCSKVVIRELKWKK